MRRRIVLAALAVCLVGAGVGCREAKREPQATRTRQARKPPALMASYNPRRVKEFVKIRKGRGEGAKVTVYISPDSAALAIGQLNFGTYVERVADYGGWYGIRYYSRDGGTFYGWVRVDQVDYIGTQDARNEVIPVEDEHKKAHLTLQESDDEMLAILAVPYKEVARGDDGGEPKKRFYGGTQPDGYDDIALLGRLEVSSETKAWAQQRQKMLVELSHRAHAEYVPILQAYYRALQWYVVGQKGRFQQQLKSAQEQRNELARHFAN